MKPPSLAQALVAAAAPTSDYEIVAGDLHEEYLRILDSKGAGAANRWYWAQALLSIPSLLSYSRTNGSVLRRVRVACIAFGVLVGMFGVLMLFQLSVQMLFGNTDPLPDWAWLSINYTAPIACGAILAWLVRTDGVRIAFYAAVFLVLCFVIPALAGHPGSQAPPAAWIELAGVIPAMCIGAGLYQAIKRRRDSAH